MTKKQQTILLAVLATVVVIAIAVVVAGVWIFTSIVHNEEMTETAATKTLEDVRARFGGVTPVIALRPTGPVLLRPAPAIKPASELRTLHILRWNIQDEQMSHVELPFAILRLKDGPFRLEMDRDDAGGSISTSLSVADIERYGSTLLMDDRLPDGGRVLIWSD
jgi:hypothetical protein